MLLLIMVSGITSSSYFIIFPKIAFATTSDDSDPEKSDDSDPEKSDDSDPEKSDDSDPEKSDDSDTTRSITSQHSDEPEEMNCKDDETLVGDECVKQCGDDETLVGDECVKQCGDDETLEGDQCEAANNTSTSSDFTAIAQAKNPIKQIEGLAGEDQVVKGGEMVTLKALDPVSSGELESIQKITWKQTAGPIVQLKASNSLNPTLIAPMGIHVRQLLSFQMKVTGLDENGNLKTLMGTAYATIDQVSTGIGSPLGPVRPGGPQMIHGEITSKTPPPGEKTSTTPPPAQESSKIKFSTYENDTEAIKIKYPSHWKITQNNNNITFHSPAENALDGYQEALRVINIPYTESLSILADQIIVDAKANLPAFQLVDSRPTIINGTSAHMITYNYRDNVFGPLEQMAIVTTKNNKAYIIGYVAEASAYPKFLPIIQNMIDSFEMGPFTPKSPPLLIFSTR
jgi:PsbP-like protein